MMRRGFATPTELSMRIRRAYRQIFNVCDSSNAWGAKSSINPENATRALVARNSDADPPSFEWRRQ